MSSPPPIRTVHVVISGFLQQKGGGTGMFRLWRELSHRHAGKDCLVHPASWSDDMADLAEMIWRASGANGEQPLVGIYAYSWGGPTAMELVRQLGLRGIFVRVMVLSDPVYRWLWALWRAFFRWPKITVPRHVKGEVHWFRQRRTWPFGHDLVAEDREATRIHPAEVIDRGHSTMDDSELFQTACRSAARKLKGES